MFRRQEFETVTDAGGDCTPARKRSGEALSIIIRRRKGRIKKEICYEKQ
ncbi:MAG: hypothetical protein J6B85_00535 [Lachnospiraceae bacterium]|nr:hypothetical protein [Lachnospiraceae bacterium]